MAVYLLSMERLHCHFVKQPRNLIRAISLPNPSANAQVGARQIGAFVEKMEYSAPPPVIMLKLAQTIKCHYRHQEHHYCPQQTEHYLTQLHG